jgi:hypothetical protein
MYNKFESMKNGMQSYLLYTICYAVIFTLSQLYANFYILYHF